MPTRQSQLDDAATKLRQAQSDLLETHRESRLKGPQNVFSRPGFAKYTSFAQNCRLRFRSNFRKPSRRIGLPNVTLPFPELQRFNNGSTFKDPANSFLEEVELWSGFKGDYLNVAHQMIDDLKRTTAETAEMMSTSNGVKLQMLVRAEPREVLLLQLCAKLKGQIDNNLLLLREHYRYPDDCTSIMHQISMFPLKLLLTPRDFLMLTTYHQEEDGQIYFAAQSIKNLLPESKGCVRGILRSFGLRIEPYSYESDKSEKIGSKVTLVYEMDPSVWVPRLSLTENLQESMFNYLSLCEPVVAQLRRTSERLRRLEVDFLKGLEAVEFKDDLPTEKKLSEIENINTSAEESVDDLRKKQQELDEELALFSSDYDYDSEGYDSHASSNLSVSSVETEDLESDEEERSKKKVTFADMKRSRRRPRRRGKRIDDYASDESFLSDEVSLNLDSESLSDISNISLE